MEFRSPDGAEWRVEVRSPSFSNAIVVFHKLAGPGSATSRYAWYQHPGAESRDVAARLDTKRLAESLGQDQLARLFRNSMPITTNREFALGNVVPRPAALEGMGGTRPARGTSVDRPQRMGIAALITPRA